MVFLKRLTFFTLITILGIGFSCSLNEKHQSVQRLRSPSSLEEAYDANRVSLKRREEIFSLVNAYLLSAKGQRLLEEILPYEFIKGEFKKGESEKISRSSKAPIEGNLVYLLEKYESLEVFLKKNVSLINEAITEDSLKKFKEKFVSIDNSQEIIEENKSLKAKRPHVFIDEEGQRTTTFKQVYSNHPIVLDDGRVVGGTDIFEAKKKFIMGLEGNVWANVFDFDLMGLADTFVEKAAAGHNIIVGIDKSNYQNKTSVRKVVDKLRKGGVRTVLVESDGLNHQKIIAGGIGIPGKGRVVFSSGNFTSSGIHRDGDLGEIGLTHEMSFPNANNFIEIHDDHMALLVKHELEKNLIYKQPRTTFPLSNFYRFVGDSIDGYGDTLVDVAFTPNGGLGDVMSRMLAPEIEKRKGDLYVATFAFPRGPINDAIFNRAQSEMKEKGKFNFIGIGDTSFAIRPWATFIEMIGHVEEKTETTNDSIYVPDFENRWLKMLGRDEMRRMVSNIYSAPFAYGRHEAKIDGDNYEFAAKLHHKLMVIDENTSTVGNSANFSNAAVEKNHEQFIIVHDPKIAERSRGIVRGLARDSSPLINTINKRRRLKLSVDEKAKILITKILSFIDSTSDDIKAAQEISDELESLIGYEKARNIILMANAERGVPEDGHSQLAFAFDLDDNVVNLETKIILYNKKTGAEKAIKTSVWRKHKKDIGSKGIYKGYEIREDSFREFEDEEKLVKDLVWAIENKGEKWKGPFFDRLVEATSTKRSAEMTSIVSGRGSRKAIYLALKKLHELGYVKYLPPRENIWCTKDPKFEADYYKSFNKNFPIQVKNAGGGDIKGEILKNILNRVSKRTISAKGAEVINSAGVESERITLWSYSEDDPAVFMRVQEILQRQIDKGKWKNIKVSLYYTGPKSYSIPLDRVVLVKGTGARPITLIEEIEWVNHKFGGQNSTISCGGTMKGLLRPGP